MKSLLLVRGWSSKEPTLQMAADSRRNAASSWRSAGISCCEVVCCAHQAGCAHSGAAKGKGDLSHSHIQYERAVIDDVACEYED